MDLSEMTDEQIDGMSDGELEQALYRLGVRPIGWAASSMEAASCMETRLAEMGLVSQYGDALSRILFDADRDILDRDPPQAVYMIAHASPADRCRAALRAVRDARKEADHAD